MNQSIKCIFCELEFSEYQRLHSHLMHSHSDKVLQVKYDALKLARKEFKKQELDGKEKKSGKKTVCSKIQKAKGAVSQNNKSNLTNRKIVLVSRQNERYDERTDCTRCKKRFHSVWKFSKTNYGTVYVCTNCKHKLLGTRVSWSRIIYNSVESNRCKH